VEGSNTLTRGLIIFGQGLNKSHPYIFPIFQNIQDNDQLEFKEPKIYPHFITEDEANYILGKAEYNYKTSHVIGEGENTDIRKSQTYWLSKDDNIAKKIINRVCVLNNVNPNQSEDIQVVKYEPDGYYKEHHDSCCDNVDHCRRFIEKSGNRILTMLVYLNDDFEGGATKFPNINKEYKPKKYSGLLFYPMNKKGDKCHTNSLHAGMPIQSGQKYIANIWIREKEF
jgi:prolyl 4-hydroxylase